MKNPFRKRTGNVYAGPEMKCVYAGPPMEDVYAGPSPEEPDTEEPAANQQTPDTPMQDPEIMEELSKTYPDQHADMNPVAAIYAAPVRPDREKDGTRAYMNNQNDKPSASSFMLVYAGPEAFIVDSPQSNAVPSWMVQSPKTVQEFQEKQNEQQAETPPSAERKPCFCPSCGEWIRNPRRFCPFCGAMLPKTEGNGTQPEGTDRV